MHILLRTLFSSSLISFAAAGQTVPLPAAITDTTGGRTGLLSAPVTDTALSRSTPSAEVTRKKAALDSLELVRSLQQQHYRAFPSSLDSVFDTRVIRPHRVLNSNATGLSEVLRTWPQVVAVPFALSSSQSRYLLYGFPLFTNAIYSGGNAFGDHADAVHGTDGLLAPQVHDASWVSPTGIRCATSPTGLISPHTDVLWENGVFLENLLGVRFARPLTKTIDAGLYSNFRHLAPYNYSTANDIKSFYSYFFTDTTLLANGGRNPLSNESQVTLSLSSHPTHATSNSLSYSYIDSKNDQSVQVFDSTSGSGTLQWRTVSRYANIIQAEMHGLPLSVLSLNIDGRAVLEGHRQYTPLYKSALVTENAGRNTDLCLGLEPFFGFGPDTLSVIGRAETKDQRLYDQSEQKATVGDLRLAFRHGSFMGPFYASFALSAGDGLVKEAGKTIRHDVVYSGTGVITAGMQRLTVYLLRDHLPFVLPYDSLAVPLESYHDAFSSYGADIFLGYGKIGMAAGVCAMSGADTSIAGRFWPDGMMPYGQGSYSLMLAPMVGRVLGFALNSRIMLSDRKPYVKSQSTLSYQADPIFGREHITADLLFDYWSVRDPLSYGGVSTWNREIFNLSLVTAVHIQGFCLFYKIDNILNRKYAYVPGYFLPGLTFRWGFQWLIPG